MMIEIHNPEVEAMIRSRMNAGGFQNAEEVIIQALKSSPSTEAPAASTPQKSIRQKSLVELCDPVRGLADDVDFSRNSSIARPLDL